MQNHVSLNGGILLFRSRHDTVFLVNEAKAGCTFETGVTNEQILRIEQKKK